jgi:hypothetical protein
VDTSEGTGDRKLKDIAHSPDDLERVLGTHCGQEPARRLLYVLARDERRESPVLCRTFSHVASAEAFIEQRLKKGKLQGFLAFWAIDSRPSSRVAGSLVAPPEVVVLIHDLRTEEHVRPFTFSDMESAFEFAGREAVKGHHVGKLFVTWAAPVEVRMSSEGSISLSPGVRPQGYGRDFSATLEADIKDALSAAEKAHARREAGRPSA